MSGVTAEIAADFIIEAQEILDRLGEQLVGLEQAPEDRDQLNAVFRGFHTLKGGAGFLGITPMVELCHAAEETLGAARSGEAGCSTGFVLLIWMNIRCPTAVPASAASGLPGL